MAFTYTDTLATDRDMLRFLIGDTVSAYAMFTDEELTALLAEHSDVFQAAGWAARIVGSTPLKVIALRDSVAGGIAVSRLLKFFGDFGDRWVG